MVSSHVPKTILFTLASSTCGLRRITRCSEERVSRIPRTPYWRIFGSSAIIHSIRLGLHDSVLLHILICECIILLVICISV